ncbi:class I SAM-dependent methyltransferase [Pseudenhygromyxa sp. WMMC2535]|uniref:class I SAM-dependent methyltransferase n=1 Tax=Pseudenhygromyxa sp. WMMC2535 TaxID=2712867 RepID=UPI001557B83E|nr:class I SAM-dependent methyltransferase [Pseudenhygromyxa sp. WMMC2535]NVB38723.1 class I SAM-dependent methyltransferase [Pseudenhygromyxa sp. WMMC2535]
MQLIRDDVHERASEADMFTPWLERVGGRVLDLGCGDGHNARLLAASPHVESIVALEMDRIQHTKNLAAEPMDKLRFGLGGAEAIPAEAEAFDMVFMFKSLHHVPVDAMAQAMRELLRVLRPGGVAYVSEPVFAGEFNEVLRLFHDESFVRERAFAALKGAVEAGGFELVEERFFLLPMNFSSYEVFEQRVIGATHTDHALDEATLAAVRSRFEGYHADNGGEFLAPQRLDVLRRV